MIKKSAKGLVLFFLITACQAKFNSGLPYLGFHEVNANGDTLYHQIPDFSFTDQDGNTITQEDYKGHIYIADFFFTSCPTICPKMTSQLKRFQQKMEGKDVMILSHSVDPKRDSVERLKWYVEKNNLNTSNWHLVTGDAQVIYDLGMEGYNISAMQDDAAPGGFLHSQMVILVDKERHIRGMYDGTSNEEMDKLAADVDLLMKEYE